MNGKYFFNRILVLSLLLTLLVSMLTPGLVQAGGLRDQPAPVGMVSYWQFEEGSGNTAGDSIGGNAGTIQGGTWAPGPVGGALGLDGVDDYMAIPNAPSLNPANITLETWVNLTADAPYWGTALMEKDGWVAGQTGFALLVGGWDRNNVICFEIFNPWTTLFSTVELELNQWYHIVATYDQNTMKLYINGVLDNSLAASQPINSGSDGHLGTGARFTDNGLEEGAGHLAGMIDEMALWERALLPEEISTHYLNGLAGFGYDVPLGWLVANPVMGDIYPGDPLSVITHIRDAENLYAAQALCTVDPSVLELQEAAFGDYFDPTLRLIAANQVDAAAGEWLGAISQSNPAGPLAGDGWFATLAYSAAAPGTTNLTCEPLFANRDGFAHPAAFSGIEITVIPFGVVDGAALYQGRLDHLGIQVTAVGTVTQTVYTDENGAFALDRLKTGDYDITADAPSYLPACATSTVESGQQVSLPEVSLKGGDVNDYIIVDPVINIGDLSLLAANFNMEVPETNPPIELTQSDINEDGVVNAQDLAILAGNYEISGCQNW
ncbi:MAG: carboxypeptidase regulatory-like domain-containing protein [Anaerolineales bacterium]|nr:carboxypeptidase regulatory-like domain-containing protein [Anaerolineales bacterium]